MMSSDVTDFKKSNTDSESSNDSGFLCDSQDSNRTFSQTSTSMNTTVSEYDAAAATSTACKVSTNHIDLLTPDAFVSPAKSSNIDDQADSASVKRSIDRRSNKNTKTVAC
jgi:hypothetical protein